jgi:oxaloacetate decarboxylase (Na+ extruding) subunit gamma
VNEGLEFMVIGMGVVFCFLMLLVVVMQANSAIIMKYFPEKEEIAVSSGNGSQRAAIAAAIAIAYARKK